jgi:8-oxo-dGTP pyrophosphatase MutT (NUDIX family)
MLYKNIFESVQNYSAQYLGENISHVHSFAESGEDCILRTRTDGHFTASGIVYNEGKILLIFHNKLQKYLQPGGHLENDVSLDEAAIREVREEVGIETSLHTNFTQSTPFHIDVHTIPENTKKGEQAHLHYDCIFLLQPHSERITLSEEEVGGYKWVSIDEKFEDGALVACVEKIKKLLA